MPSQAILKAHTSPLANIPVGAYWLSDSEPMDFEELKQLVKESSTKIKNLLDDQHTEIKDVEIYIKHFGYSVSSYIDAGIIDLDDRMKEISALYDEYDNSDDDIEIANELRNKSLSLGYDLQMSTQHLMQELGITGEPIDASRIRGHQELKDLIVKHSMLFPSSWQTSVSYKYKKISLVNKDSFKFNIKKFRREEIKKTSAFSPGEFQASKPETFEIVYGDDGEFSYPSLKEAEDAATHSPLEFHTKHEIVHEMTHMYEQDYDLGVLTESFLKGRISKDEETGGIIYDKKYSSDQRIRYADHFPNALCGSVNVNQYDASNLRDNEILARGTESILCGSNGSFIGLPEYSQVTKLVRSISPDIDYRNFMLGILFGYRK